MDERRGSKALLGSVLLLLWLVLVGVFVSRVFLQQRDAAARVHAAWRHESVAHLMALNKATDLSAEEQSRLNRAGEDPAQVRQALVEIHELRLAYLRRDLDGAQGLAAQRLRAQAAVYADALSRLRNWQPVSNLQYAADRPRNQAAPTRRKVALPASPDKPSPGVALESGNPLTSSAANAEANLFRRSPSFPSHVNAAVADPANDAFARAERTRDEAEIRATLQQWAHAMVLNDPRAESAEYSTHLDRYFLRRNVDKRFVEADKAAYLRRGNITASFVPRDLQFEHETADVADVRLIKDVAWQRSGGIVEHRQIRSRLHLVKTPEGWRIAGEQDLR